MTHIAHNITTIIGEGELNPLGVVWDMAYYYGVPADRHPDDTCQMQEEHRSIGKIHSVEVILFDKIGVDMTAHFTGHGASKVLMQRLEKELLDAVEDKKH